MAVVRGQRVDLVAVGVERKCEVLAVFHPEVAVEAALEIGRLLLESFRELDVLPHQARQAGAAQLRVVGVALELARRAGEARKLSVAVGDRVPRVLPALVLEARLLVAAPVRDVAVAHQVGVLVDPVQRGARLALEVADEPPVAGPALVLVEQHDVERRRVGAAVVRRVRTLLERRHLAVAHLVEDSPGVLVAEVVDAAALPVSEGEQRRRRELRRERQRLEAREDAVAAEHRHEPGQAGRGQAPASGDGGEKRSAARSTRLRRYVAFSGSQSHSTPRCVGEPPLQAALHVGAGPAVALVLRTDGVCPPAPSRGDDVEIGRPLTVGRKPDLEGQTLLVEPRPGRRRDHRLALIRLRARSRAAVDRSGRGL